MACTTCRPEPVLLASSTAVLTAGVDSFDPSVASNIFVGYIAKKAPTPLPRCKSNQHPTAGAVYRASLIANSLILPHYIRRCEEATLDRRLFAPDSGRQGNTRENAIVLVGETKLRSEVQMHFAHLINLPRSYECAGGVPQYSSLARLFRERSRDGQPLRDEEERSDGGTLAWRRD
jgi:hypothetical protein